MIFKNHFSFLLLSVCCLWFVWSLYSLPEVFIGSLVTFSCLLVIKCSGGQGGTKTLTGNAVWWMRLFDFEFHCREILVGPLLGENLSSWMPRELSSNLLSGGQSSAASVVKAELGRRTRGRGGGEHELISL